MSQVVTFDKQFAGWHLSDKIHLSISHISSKGRDLDDMLTNAEISFQDWHGNEAGEGWGVDELSNSDYDEVCRLFNEALAGA